MVSHRQSADKQIRHIHHILFSRFLTARMQRILRSLGSALGLQIFRIYRQICANLKQTLPWHNLRQRLERMVWVFMSALMFYCQPDRHDPARRFLLGRFIRSFIFGIADVRRLFADSSRSSRSQEHEVEALSCASKTSRESLRNYV